MALTFVPLGWHPNLEMPENTGNNSLTGSSELVLYVERGCIGLKAGMLLSHRVELKKKKKDSERNGISREQEQRSSSEGSTHRVRADCPEDVVVNVRVRKEILLPLQK